MARLNKQMEELQLADSKGDSGAAPQGGGQGGDRPPKGFKKGKKNKIWGIFMH